MALIAINGHFPTAGSCRLRSIPSRAIAGRNCSRTLAILARLSGKMLLVMVGLAFDDGAGAVDLLGKYEAYHLVGESHPGE